MSDRPDAGLAVKAFEMADQQRGCPSSVLFHSGQVSQYGNRVLRQRLLRYRITLSMSRHGNCWDNVSMERLFRSLRETRRDISNYLMNDYN